MTAAEKKRAIPALIATFVAYSSIYIARVNLSAVSPQLIAGGVLSSAQFGLAGSAFSICYAVGRFAAGRICDRAAPWKMLLPGLAAAGLSNVLLGTLPPFLGILLLCATNAFGQSILWGSCLHVIEDGLPEDAAKKTLAYFPTATSLGTVLGYLLDTELATKLGISFAFILPGIFCLICAAAVFLTTKYLPDPVAKTGKSAPIKGVFTTRDVSGFMLPALLHGIMKDNISLWLPAFFVGAFGVDLQNAVWYVIAVPVVGLVGRLVYPWVYALMKQREDRVNLLGFAICVAAALVLLMMKASMLTAAVCFAVLYAALCMANTSYLSMYPARFSEKGCAAFVSGIMDLLTYLGAAIGSALFGWLIEKTGNYDSMFLCWLAASALATLLSVAAQKKGGEG